MRGGGPEGCHVTLIPVCLGHHTPYNLAGGTAGHVPTYSIRCSYAVLFVPRILGGTAYETRLQGRSDRTWTFVKTKNALHRMVNIPPQHGFLHTWCELARPVGHFFEKSLYLQDEIL